MFWTVWVDKFKATAQKRAWDNRKIAFVSILIAVSVVFVLLMTSVLPFLIWPSLKISIGGLPIKITGYIFGPFVGIITGVTSDLLTFSFRPTYFHWAYTLAFAMAGFIPGVFGHFMNRRWRNNKDFENSLDTKINKFNVIFTYAMMITIAVGFVLLIVLAGDDIFDESDWTGPGKTSDDKPLISNKWLFLGIALSGQVSMMVGLFAMKFFMAKKTYNTIVPIVAFSALLEIVNTPLITLGDVSVLGTHGSSGFVTVMSTHFMLSPVKIWINMLVIYTAYKIVSPLIYNKTANGWD